MTAAASPSVEDYDLILFDLDGTLLDTAAEITDSVNDALRESGLTEVSLAQTRGWVGQGAQNFLEQVLSHLNPSVKVDFDAVFAIFMRQYALHSGQNSQLYPHVHEALTHLKTQGKRLCVVTNKVKSFSDQALRAHGLLSYFDYVIGGDSFENKKPHPQGALHCMQACGVASGRTLFVGDSKTDVQTARNAGIAVWALPYGYNHGERIENAGADKIIPDFSVFL